MGAKPAAPLPEPEMITIILSEKTLSILGQDKETGVLVLPVSPQDLNARFMKSEVHQSMFIEKSINPSDAVFWYASRRQCMEGSLLSLKIIR
jgi:hypothetical protein